MEFGQHTCTHANTHNKHTHNKHTHMRACACTHIHTRTHTYDLVPKGVHENRTKGVENKVDDTLKLVVFLECAQC